MRYESSWLPNSKPELSSRLRLFCYPHAGGAASVFSSWKNRLPAGVELCALQPPGRWERHREKAHRRVSAAAEDLHQNLASLLDRPCVLLGHSLGALIMYEVACRLQKTDGSFLRHLLVAAQIAPHLPRIGRPPDFSSDEALLAWVTELYGAGRLVGLDDPTMRELFLPLLQADLEALGTYHYEERPRLKCALSAFGGKEDSSSSDAGVSAWAKHTEAGFSSAMLPGDHFFLHDEKSGFLACLQNLLEGELTR